MKPFTSPDVFDLTYWTRLFPWPQCQLTGLHGPSTVAIIEQIRQRAGGAVALGPSVPTDFFVLGKGEPLRRDMTKVGGLPYRPAHIEWPRNERGEPMTFVAQFQFAPSSDIVGELPGDVLLIFAAEEHLYSNEEPPYFHFEWYPNGLGNLVDQRGIPEPAWEFVKCFGVRHRSVDYLDDQRAAKAIENYFVSERSPIPQWERMVGLYRYWGIKIGGIPFFADADGRAPPHMGGRFICSLTDIAPSYGGAYPWINIATPMEPDFQVTGPDVLLWYDGFVVNFFLNTDGKVQWYAKLW